ncbi:MAG: hypothetical protein A2V67_09240 [Deltaproteobacteria bacterium RBG_13_61_14]|nr:MAG: hypothetical protein A2V67_09240 [Deltaproteobacteria bacterium RBG_13_61_14]
MRARKWNRYGWLALITVLAAGLIWITPLAAPAQQKEQPAFETEGPLAPPPPPGPGRPGPRGARVHQPADRPIRDQQGMGPGMGPGTGPGMGQGGGRRWGEALERMKTENPERYQRISKIRELADRYRATTEAAEKKRIEKELRPLLDTELKAIQADNQKKIEELEKRLDEEKRKQKEREQNWDAYRDYQFNRITGKDDYRNLPLGPWK